VIKICLKKLVKRKRKKRSHQGKIIIFNLILRVPGIKSCKNRDPRDMLAELIE
jgi:hypothetical protein